MPKEEDKPVRCIICWLQQTQYSKEEAAAFMMGEEIKYPGSLEKRFKDLCPKHTRSSIKMGGLSNG